MAQTLGLPSVSPYSNTTLVKVKYCIFSNKTNPFCIQIQHLLKLNIDKILITERYAWIQIQHLLKLNFPLYEEILQYQGDSNTTLVKVKLKEQKCPACKTLIQIQHLLKLNFSLNTIFVSHVSFKYNTC